MDAEKWLISFRVMHDQWKKKALNDNEKARYLAMRDELARSLMETQGQKAPDGVLPRRAVRVAQLFNIEVDGKKSMTRELSCTSFITIMQAGFTEGATVPVTLNLGRSVEPVMGQAVITSALKQAGTSTRVVADFKGLLDPALERIEEAVFDSILLRIK
ncbi:MAG: hypothetical protein U0228_07040 [Myxococcaceae bacterium]